MSFMYWENPIHKNIVNPIPISNTIAQAIEVLNEAILIYVTLYII